MCLKEKEQTSLLLISFKKRQKDRKKTQNIMNYACTFAKFKWRHPTSEEKEQNNGIQREQRDL